MGRAGNALESVVCTATGVIFGLAPVDEWLGAHISKTAITSSVVAGKTEEEYKELVELMSAIGCM